MKKDSKASWPTFRRHSRTHGRKAVEGLSALSMNYVSSSVSYTMVSVEFEV